MRNASPQHALELFGHRKRLAGCRQPLPGQRPAQLDREQRISECRVDDLAQQLPRKAQPEPLGQQMPDCPKVQRVDLETLDSTAFERLFEPGRTAGALGQQEADCVVLQPAGGERKHVGGTRIQPLSVVDRNQQRPSGCHRAQRVQESECDRTRLWRFAVRLRPYQRHLQSAQLRPR